MRSHSKALFAVMALFALFALTPVAQGAPLEVISSFGETGTEGGQLSSPAGLAVNQASGDVYVANAGNNRIEQFSADGAFIRAWGKDVVQDGGPGDIPPTPILVNEQQTVGIAGPFDFGCFCLKPVTGGSFTLSFDGQTTTAIPYDASAAQVQSALESLSNIDAVLVTGGPGPGAEWTVEFTGALAGTDVAEMSADAGALEPSGSSGSVATAQNGSTTLYHPFEICTVASSCQPGTVGTGEGELSLTPDATPQLAIDQADGSLYVADTENSRIQKFSSSGAFLDEFGVKGTGGGELDLPRGVAVDPSTGDIYVADTNNNRVQRFDNTGAFKYAITTGASGFVIPYRLAADSLGRLYVLESGNNRVQRFDNTGAFEKIFDPSQLGSPTELAVDPATNHPYIASSNPDAIFEFDEAGELIETYGASADIAPGGLALPSASNRIYVSDMPEDRVMKITFSIDPVPPLVEGLPAAVVTESSAWLGAEINPRKWATSFWIEYSTEEDLKDSTSVPAGKNTSAGKGNAFVLANQLVKGLEPETTYYFRVVAANAGGTTEGEVGSFTTLADLPPVQGLPDGRVWEKVSPAYKAGAHINPANRTDLGGVTGSRSQAGDHGDAVAFASDGKFGGDGGPPQSQYLAKRGPGGWVTEGISPRLTPNANISNLNFYQWFAEDLSWGVVKTNAALNPGDPEKLNQFNLYLRDNETKTYRLIPDAGAVQLQFRAASEDGATTVFTSGETLSNDGKLFQRTANGDVEAVGILPGGAEVPVGIGSGKNILHAPGFNPVSADGSRVYFTPLPSPSVASALYLREGGATIQVSASERSDDDPDEPHVANFLGASKDGSVVFFASNNALTDDSNAPPSNTPQCGGLFNDATPILCAHLYRWDSNAPEGNRLTDLTTADPLGSLVYGMTGMSDDGSSAYFVAAGDLTGIGNRAAPKLYLWREGEGIRLVANAGDQGLWRTEVDIANRHFGRARVTPDGRFLAFESQAQLTGYDTDGTTQLYLYDSATEKLTCASCSTLSGHSKGSTWLLSSVVIDEQVPSANANERLSANLSPDGRRLVFDSKDALVPGDSNGAVDVYEWQEGRLHLLSSGTSAQASRLLDASKDLDDVFFTTEQQLVRSDNDTLRDLYDARVGGVPEPDVTPPCVADECQGTPSPPPAFQTPSSSSARGTGNVTAKKRRCARGKVRRKGRCVKRKARKAKGQKQGRNAKRANSNRRAGR